MAGTLILFSMLCISHSDSFDKAPFLALLEASKAPIDTGFTCDYEVTVWWTKSYVEDSSARNHDGAVSLLTGRLKHQSKIGYYLELSTLDNVKNQKTLTINGCDFNTETSYTKNDDKQSGFADIYYQNQVDYTSEISFFELYPYFQLRSLLLNESSRITELTSGKLEGKDYQVLKIKHYNDSPSDTAFTTNYWYTLDNGFRIYRVELYTGPLLLRRMDIKMYQEYLTKQGDAQVVPVEGIGTTHIYLDRKTGKFLQAPEPTITRRFLVMKDSFKIDLAFQQNDMKVALPDGTTVYDRVRKLSYQSGQDLRASPRTSVEANNRLNDYLEKSGAAMPAVKAPSLARSGLSWVTVWSPWIITVGALLSALIIYMKRRR